jgi:hypothetical protein
MSPLSYEWARKADAAITMTRPWVVHTTAEDKPKREEPRCSA